MEHQVPVPLKELLEVTHTSSSTVKSLVSKGALAELDQEIYRDPYENRVFQPSNPFTLTDEQAAALKPIQEKIHHDEHDVFLYTV